VNRRRREQDSEVEKRYWTVKDAARYLNISPVTFYGWLTDQGVKRPVKLFGSKPPHCRFGVNVIRIPIKEFIEWVNKREDSNKCTPSP